MLTISDELWPLKVADADSVPAPLDTGYGRSLTLFVSEPLYLVVVGVGRAHRQHRGVGPGVRRRAGAVVAGRGHHEHAVVVGVLHRVLQGGAAAGAVDAHADHPGTVVGGVGDAARDLRPRAPVGA